MKKTILLIVIFLFIGLSANAEVFKAETLTQINTETPPATLSIKAISNMQLDNLLIKKGCILNGDVIDVIHPQSFGKNATFSYRLTSYKDLDGIIHNIEEEHIIKYRQKLKPNWERQSFSLMASGNGAKTEAGIELSPYDFKLMKNSKNVGEYLWKDLTKDSFWQPGWELKYKSGEIIYFNY